MSGSVGDNSSYSDYKYDTQKEFDEAVENDPNIPLAEKQKLKKEFAKEIDSISASSVTEAFDKIDKISAEKMQDIQKTYDQPAGAPRLNAAKGVEAPDPFLGGVNYLVAIFSAFAEMARMMMEVEQIDTTKGIEARNARMANMKEEMETIKEKAQNEADQKKDDATKNFYAAIAGAAATLAMEADNWKNRLSLRENSAEEQTKMFEKDQNLPINERQFSSVENVELKDNLHPIPKVGEETALLPHERLARAQPAIQVVDINAPQQPPIDVADLDNLGIPKRSVLTPEELAARQVHNDSQPELSKDERKTRFFQDQKNPDIAARKYSDKSLVPTKSPVEPKWSPGIQQVVTELIRSSVQFYQSGRDAEWIEKIGGLEALLTNLRMLEDAYRTTGDSYNSQKEQYAQMLQEMWRGYSDFSAKYLSSINLSRG